MFIDRIVNLQNTVFEDYTTDSYKRQTLSLIQSYRATRDELYALELVNMYESIFIKQARRINNLQDRQDLVLLLVEIFITLIDEYDSSRSSFAYVASKKLEWATLNFIRDTNTRTDGQSQYTLQDIEEISSEHGCVEQPVDDLPFVYYQLLDCLSPLERRVFEQNIISGVSRPEIARMEGVKKKVVDNALLRAKDKVRQAYREMKEDGLF